MADRLIDTQAELDELIDACSATVGVDTEFMRTDTFYPIPAIYQISADDRVGIVDAQADLDFSGIAELFSSPDVVKVMHACSEDLEVIDVHLGVRPDNLIDNQVAHAFVRPEFSKSYAALVDHYMGIELAKSSTRSDWLRRPLSATQSEYAADDVLHLVPIWTDIADTLEAQNRMSWFEEEMARLLSPSGTEEYYRTIKGIWRLSPSQLAVLRSLVEWREVEARRSDVPRSRTVWDAHLVELAKRNRSDIGTLRDVLPPAVCRRYADAIQTAFEQGAQADDLPEQLPAPLSSKQAGVVRALRAIAGEIAQDLGLAVELLGRKRDVERCLRHFEQERELPAWFGEWRIDLMGERFIAVLNGTAL